MSGSPQVNVRNEVAGSGECSVGASSERVSQAT